MRVNNLRKEFLLHWNSILQNGFERESCRALVDVDARPFVVGEIPVEKSGRATTLEAACSVNASILMRAITFFLHALVNVQAFAADPLVAEDDHG